MKKTLLIFAVFLWAGLQLALAQSRPVRGKVLDDKGNPVEAASVSVKDGDGATMTEADGSFSLDVPDDNNTLVIEALGYATKEVDAGDGDQVLNIRLAQGDNTLAETIVTALNITKAKRALGYSVSEVDSAAIEKSGERNIVDALAAKAPGVQVTSSGGTPGASARIVLRGNGFFNGDNTPLIVVDGIPIDNTTSQPVAGDYPYNMNLTGVNESNRALDINPDDIESVSVLKGPTAATLYGVRGSNGAIMITTKKGKYGKGQGLGITFNSSIEVNKVSQLPERQTIYGQGNWDANGVPVFGANTPYSWGPKIGSDSNVMRSYNNYDNFFQTGVGFNNTVAISGGTDISTFRVSLGNYNTKGIVPNSMLDRNTVNLSGELKPAPWLTIGGQANYTYEEARMVQNGSNTAGTMLSLMRSPSSYDISKNYYDPETGETHNYFNAYDNPLFTVYRNPYNTYTNRVVGKLYFNADITKDLKLLFNINADAYGTQTRQIYDIGSVGNDLADGGGQLNKSSTDYMQIYSDLMLRYNKDLTEDFNFGAMLGYNYWYQESRYNFMRGYPFVLPNLYNFGNTTTYFVSNGDGYERTQALYGELDFSYKTFLYLTLTGRNEWATAYPGHSFFYPHADLSWIFTEHLPKNHILTYGKLRAAYADAASTPDAYTFNTQVYYTQPYLTDGWGNGNGFPYNGNQGFMPSNVINAPDMVPQNILGKEIGLELYFWDNKIKLEATYYHQLSKDMFITRPIAPTAGFQYEYGNGGNLVNQGVELALNYDVIKTKDIDFNVGINWSKNVSKVTELVGGVDEISIESGFTQIGSYAIVGQPYGVFYGTDWERNDQGQILIDENGEPTVTTESKNLGDPNPDWLMGITGDFSYKGFHVSMLWDIRHGGKIWNGTWSRLNNVGITDESAVNREGTFVIPGVYAPGTSQEGQVNTTAVDAQTYYRYYLGDLGAASNAVQDGGWVRLRAVNLSYRFTFAHNDKSRNPFRYVEVGVTGRNLFLHTKYKGVDPETSLTGAGSNLLGWDYFNNPGSKSYIFNLKFGL